MVSLNMKLPHLVASVFLVRKLVFLAFVSFFVACGEKHTRTSGEEASNSPEKVISGAKDAPETLVRQEFQRLHPNHRIKHVANKELSQDEQVFWVVAMPENGAVPQSSLETEFSYQLNSEDSWNLYHTGPTVYALTSPEEIEGFLRERNVPLLEKEPSEMHALDYDDSEKRMKNLPTFAMHAKIRIQSINRAEDGESIEMTGPIHEIIGLDKVDFIDGVFASSSGRSMYRHNSALIGGSKRKLPLVFSEFGNYVRIYVSKNDENWARSKKLSDIIDVVLYVGISLSDTYRRGYNDDLSGWSLLISEADWPWQHGESHTREGRYHGTITPK